MPNVSRVLILILLCLFMTTVPGFGQPAEIQIRNLTPPTGSWGDQRISFEAFNSQEYVKFLVVEATVEFEGGDSPYIGEHRFSTVLEPGVWLRIRPEVTIPGNYGKATVCLEFFDVVDTMDAILPGQGLFDTSFTMTVAMPESARPWLDKGVVFPPRVDEHPYFDNQFMRMMYAMIGEGLSGDDIARITGADPGYVQLNLSRMTGRRCLKHDGQNYRPTFPLVLVDEAEDLSNLADSTASVISSMLAANYPKFRSVLDSLAAANRLLSDSNNVLGPGRILHRPYVFMSAVILWHELGTRFVTDNAPLMVFSGTDVCNASNPDYMYAVPPDERYNGNHFYAYIGDPGKERIWFADHHPIITCEGNFPARPGVGTRATWRYSSDDPVEYYVFSPGVAEPLVSVLTAGTEAVLEQSLTSLYEISVGYGRESASRGYRYWFWNLVASRTLEALVERGVLHKQPPGNFIVGTKGA
ncbi:MAG: hypothetical protein JSV52_02240 [Candidatus Zixiibacteriota bacterium]|nr:MAG: hypothetical protein JSV52_02240 [candidate division Zixibacteria bacterium]